MKVSRMEHGKFYLSVKRYHLAIANLISISFGIGLIVVGLIEWTGDIFQVLKEELRNSKEWCIFLGSFTVGSCMLGFVAIFTSGRATRWLRWLHYVSSFLIICSLIACADMSTHIHRSLQDHIKMLYSEYNTHSKTAVDEMQRTLECCGLTAKTNTEVQKGNHLVDSCCPEEVDVCEESVAYESSCSSKISLISTYSKIITALALLTALSLIVLLIVIFLLKWETRNREVIRAEENEESLDMTEFTGSIAPSHKEQQILSKAKS